MNYLFRHGTLLIFVAGVLSSGAGSAGGAEGIKAIEKGDYVTALSELRPLGERGNADAQFRLGWMYEFGHGVGVDKAQAMVWYGKAAEQGNASAQLELGVIYGTGDGLPKDDAQAVAWFQKAATQGKSTAQFNLGWAYEHGEGVAKDDVLAYATYEIAAREGNEKYVSRRAGIARQLTPQQMREGRALASAWVLGTPMPAKTAALKDQAATMASVAANAAIPASNVAKGTLLYKTRSATLRYAWLVNGPYVEDPSKTVRRLILSAGDISAALQACKTIMCADDQVTERMTVDFDVSPRLNYWIALISQKE